ncbi:MAG: GNAT family N-acetyltransferase [Clostridia bacterium]|nr:GNAT family N-acetyltransferase [Clostridia bacterium]
MRRITARQFQPLSDSSLLWDLAVDDYAPRCENGMAAPFFEYALTSSWMDKRFLYLDRLWFDGPRLVGFTFYESPVSTILFHLRAGYEALAEEMIAWADGQMPGAPGEKELILFPGQQALLAAAEARGYRLDHVEEDWMLDLRAAAPDRPLPAGFHWVPPEECDAARVAKCAWKGFGHEASAPFVDWAGEDPGTPWNPQKSYRNILSCMMAPPPHATYEYNVVIADSAGEYACYAGMWWVPQNRLAYMEPLCTIPEYRGRGLASAALSLHCRRMRALGAEWMTGGGGGFYRKIGYRDAMRRLVWKR